MRKVNVDNDNLDKKILHSIDKIRTLLVDEFSRNLLLSEQSTPYSNIMNNKLFDDFRNLLPDTHKLKSEKLKEVVRNFDESCKTFLSYIEQNNNLLITSAISSKTSNNQLLTFKRDCLKPAYLNILYILDEYKIRAEIDYKLSKINKKEEEI